MGMVGLGKAEKGSEKKVEKEKSVYGSDEERDKIIVEFLDSIHKKNPKISEADDNALEMDKQMWQFISGDQYFEPDTKGDSVVLVRKPEEEAEHMTAKVNVVSGTIKTFAAKMVEKDMEPLTVKMPENRDYMDMTMAAFFNALSRVIWRRKECLWEAYLSAKDGGVTGKCHIGVLGYSEKKKNGGLEGDFDFLCLSSLETFGDIDARKPQDREYVYWRRSMSKMIAEKRYKIKIKTATTSGGEDELYNYGEGRVTIWDVWAREGLGDIKEAFHAVIVGDTPENVIFYEKWDCPRLPVNSAGMNVSGTKALYGRGFCRDLVGMQLAMNSAHGVAQEAIHNYRVMMWADKDTKIEFEHIKGHEIGYYSGGAPPQASRPPDIPQWIFNYPSLLQSLITDTTGIRDFSKVPDQGNRMAASVMNVLVTSEKQSFTEEMIQFSRMIANAMQQAFWECQRFYSKEKLLDLVGKQHLSAINIFKEIGPDGKYTYDVFENVDFHVDVGPGFQNNMAMTPQDLAMLTKVGIYSPDEARLYQRRLGFFKPTDFGTQAGIEKATRYLDNIISAKTPEDLMTVPWLNAITAFDDVDTMMSVAIEFLRSDAFVEMITNDPQKLGIAKKDFLERWIMVCRQVKVAKAIADMQDQAKIEAAKAQIMMQLAPQQPLTPPNQGQPPQGGAPGIAQPGQGQQAGNPEQMPRQM